MDIIDQSCLEQQVSSGKQVVTDEILIGSHSYIVADTQGTENIQNLQGRMKNILTMRVFYCFKHIFMLHISQRTNLQSCACIFSSAYLRVFASATSCAAPKTYFMSLHDPHLIRQRNSQVKQQECTPGETPAPC